MATSALRVAATEHNVPAGRADDHIQSLERGLAVIRVFNASFPELTLADAAKRAGLTRATTRRVLHTLQTLGYVTTNGRLFLLTPKVLDLGYAYLSSLQVGDIALPFMENLSERVHESVSAAVLDGVDIVYVARVPTRKIMRLALSLGSRLPAATTSMGRVLLAGLAPTELSSRLEQLELMPHTDRSTVRTSELRDILDTVRAQGWCLVDQELEDGVRSIAAPLRDRSGRVVAALNIGTQVGVVSLKELRSDLLPKLLECASTISAQLAKR